ncbi:ubiquitin carboxyl-terminal hydrolase 35 [Amyelois transitella]|uniref:ubiquitin carboxyl-terminal hydrolase 35 n=1 Tax=Amyelois transitella TaxID=680683 RepID=UPI00067D3B1B|nr:ubiquitin carboxyl-terminal hydrolase 35 [Amyelois transitella]
MAVKKHELVHDNRQLDLTALAQYLQLMNEQPNYLPPANEIIKTCQDIVKCLSRSTYNEDELYDILHTIEVFLLRIVTAAHSSLRHEIVTAILDKFHAIISDPQSDASPATSIVLVVLDWSDQDATLSAARWLVQQEENGPAGAGLRASLSCLYRWLYEWHATPTLGDWVMAYIKALEENKQFDILIEVSVDNLSRLFLAMDNPIGLRQSVADVIFHILASLRESTEALDRLSPHVGRVLVNLAADSGQFSRQLLQNVVDILTSTLDRLSNSLRGDAQDLFKNKYADVILCLERHMASRCCRYTQLPPWEAREECVATMASNATMPRVGLLNLGNTCYMNSVFQALLATKQFSTHVVLRMNGAPYWSKMGILFAKMMHCIGTKLSPKEFVAIFKPPFFVRNNQHDSSEFLGYLFELLQSYEHCSDRNFDYSRPAVLNNRMRAIASATPQPSSSSDHEIGESARRSVSPRPGSSAAGSSSGAVKRANVDELHIPLKKRLRHSYDPGFPRHDSAFLRRDSYIDSLFGGVLLTRVECTECHSSSLSRDVFRDLQLAFPEKPEGWQHNVQNLLEFYCSKERLSGDNQYECHDCGGLRDAERSVLIETTPKYLILVLKYFKFEPKLQVQTKLMHSIYHNHTVTLPTVRSQADHSTYSLYAAVIHMGTTLDSGHYYTLAKDNDEWHTYNDDEVAVSDESHLNNLHRASTPYILFYRRTDIEEGPAVSFEEMPTRLQESVLSHNKCFVDTVQQVRLGRQ